jgi:hypothetical protein
VSLVTHVGDAAFFPGEGELDELSVGKAIAMELLEGARVRIPAGEFVSHRGGTPGGEPPVRHGGVQHGVIAEYPGRYGSGFDPGKQGINGVHDYLLLIL